MNATSAEDDPLVDVQKTHLQPGQVYLFTPTSDYPELTLTGFAGQQRSLHIICRTTVVAVIDIEGFKRFVQADRHEGWIVVPNKHLLSAFKHVEKLYRYQYDVSNNRILFNGRLVLGRDWPYLLLTTTFVVVGAVLFVLAVDLQFTRHKWTLTVRDTTLICFCFAL